MSFHQRGANAIAVVGVANDVGGNQYNVTGNEIFQIFDFYITINIHNKIIIGNNNTFNNLGPNETHEALIGRKSQFSFKYTKIY